MLQQIMEKALSEGRHILYIIPIITEQDFLNFSIILNSPWQTLGLSINQFTKGKTAKTLYYVTSSKWLMQYIADCRVRSSYTFNTSDHRLIVCRMQTPRRKIDRVKFVRKNPSTKRFNIANLKDQYVASNFVSEVDRLCAAIENKNISVDNCSKLCHILEEAATNTLPDIIKTVEARLWDTDEELTRLNQLRDKTNRQQNKQEHQRLTKLIKNRFNYIRHNYYQNEASEINSVNEARNFEKLFCLAKN